MKRQLVAAAGDGLDAAFSAASLVENAPQGGNVHRQIVRLHGHARARGDHHRLPQVITRNPARYPQPIPDVFALALVRPTLRQHTRLREHRLS